MPFAFQYARSSSGPMCRSGGTSPASVNSAASIFLTARTAAEGTSYENESEDEDDDPLNDPYVALYELKP